MNRKIKLDEVLEELDALTEQKEALEARNLFLKQCVEGLKLNLSKTTLERNELCTRVNKLSKELQDIKQMSMFEFGNRYCTSESLEADGHAFAKALLGGK